MNSWMFAAAMAARVPHPAPADVPDEPVPVETIGASDDSDSDTVREVVVHREADQLSATAITVGRREIDTMPKRGAADMLRHVPGMHIVQHGGQGKGYQFYLRGFDAVHGADIETQLNDVPINEASNVHAHGYLDLAFIIPEAVYQAFYRLDDASVQIRSFVFDVVQNQCDAGGATCTMGGDAMNTAIGLTSWSFEDNDPGCCTPPMDSLVPWPNQIFIRVYRTTVGASCDTYQLQVSR